jgi:lipoprotein-anchoring transpeptidase ErfK/SrfK
MFNDDFNPPSTRFWDFYQALNEAITWRVFALVMVAVSLSLAVGWGLAETVWATPSALSSTVYPPELQAAWQRQDWSEAIGLLNQMQQAQPESRLIAGWLAQAHLQKAVLLRQKGFIKEAQAEFTQVLTLTPNQPLAQKETQLAQYYLAGVAAYQARQWLPAITQFEALWQQDPNYVNVTDLLYSSYFNQGVADQAAANQEPDSSITPKLLHFLPLHDWPNKKLTEARHMFELALTLRPNQVEPRQQLAQLNLELPQSDSAIEVKEKLIVVGLDEQRMWVYEQGKKRFDFIVSTGEPGQETAVGEFKILNKIDVAYASTWDLDMPYWMGIYWSGTLQNGIHALPIVRYNGYKLWEGFLGQPVSFGCVILSDEDAATLYQWANVGVKMKVVPSLWEWLRTQSAEDLGQSHVKQTP